MDALRRRRLLQGRGGRPVSRLNIFSWRFLIRGRDIPGGVPMPSAEYRVVSGDLFSALRIAIRQGRGFQEQDSPDSLPVAIVNETMARRY